MISLYAHIKYFVVDLNGNISWTVLEHVASSIPVHLARRFLSYSTILLCGESNFLFYERDWS